MTSSPEISLEVGKGGDDLGLILTSAFYFPDEDIRRGLREKVDRWIEQQEPLHEQEEVASAIFAHQGTPLEPLVLKPEDVQLAAALVRLSFSGRSKASRFRIVSRSSMDRKGGLIVTRSLNAYYAERFPMGKNPQRNHHCDYFLSGWVPTHSEVGKDAGSRVTGRLEINDEGIRIFIPFCSQSMERGMLGFSRDDSGIYALNHEFQQSSYILGYENDLDRFGLRFRSNPEGIELVSGSPESCIQLSALLLRNPILVIQGWSTPRGQHVCLAELSLPEEGESTCLDAVHVAAASRPAWMSSESGGRGTPEIDSEEKLAISRWLAPHVSWVNDLYSDL